MTLDELSHTLTHAFPFAKVHIDCAHVDICALDRWVVVEWSPLREGFGLSLLDVGTIHMLYPSPDHHVETLEQLIDLAYTLLTTGKAA